ncbi:stress response protein NST1-like [Papaver somniferum]|uniref:stress response protein NST1-like n=1 Tax=Papaver somniferum TaxID=3469 RepID=UPI000E700777|nr:stress response protein NST1-like [Papaver somniferum]
MIFTIGTNEELVATQKDVEEVEKTTMDGEKNREMTPEKGIQFEIKQSRKAKKRKMAEENEAEGSFELHDSLDKGGKDREEEEMERLKKELYQERRKKEDLVRERIRLERQNEKLVIKNDHLRRKQAENNAKRGKYAPEGALAIGGCREYRQERKERGKKN